MSKDASEVEPQSECVSFKESFTRLNRQVHSTLTPDSFRHCILQERSPDHLLLLLQFIQPQDTAFREEFKRNDPQRAPSIPGPGLNDQSLDIEEEPEIKTGCSFWTYAFCISVPEALLWTHSIY